MASYFQEGPSTPAQGERWMGNAVLLFSFMVSGSRTIRVLYLFAARFLILEATFWVGSLCATVTNKGRLL